MEKYPLLLYNGKRPDNCGRELRKELIRYLKERANVSHYPTRRELENNFSFKMTGVFRGIEELYEDAGIAYKPIHNQQIKSDKAELLTEVIIKILTSQGLKIINKRSVRERGVDLIAVDRYNRRIGFELKAYNQYERVKKRNIRQVKRFLRTENLDSCYLVTTSNRISKNLTMPKEIVILNYNQLSKLVNQNDIKKLEHIRTYSVHKETETKRTNKKIIIQYTIEQSKKGIPVTYNKILRELHLDLYTYFEDIFDLFKQANLMPPNRLIFGRRASTKKKGRIFYKKLVRKMLDYIKKEVCKGHYPTGTEIGEKFGMTNIWNFIKVSDLYSMLGIPSYRQRKQRIKS